MFRKQEDVRGHNCWKGQIPQNALDAFQFECYDYYVANEKHTYSILVGLYRATMLKSVHSYLHYYTTMLTKNARIICPIQIKSCATNNPFV